MMDRGFVRVVWQIYDGKRVCTGGGSVMDRGMYGWTEACTGGMAYL